MGNDLLLADQAMCSVCQVIQGLKRGVISAVSRFTSCMSPDLAVSCTFS